MGITTNIGDRLHLILQELTTATAERYLVDATSDPAKMPCACPIPVSAQHDTTRTGLNFGGSLSNYTIRVFLGSLTQQLPGQNLQLRMESVIDELEPLLLKRTTLENSSLEGLGYINQSMYQGWSVVWREPYAYIDFRLLIRHTTPVPIGT